MLYYDRHALCSSVVRDHDRDLFLSEWNTVRQEVFLLITRILTGFCWNNDIAFIDEFSKDSSGAYMGTGIRC